MKRKKLTIPRKLVLSFVVFCFATAFMFSFVFYCTNQKSRNSIDEIGEIYMKGINEKNIQHFQTIVELRIMQLKALVDGLDLSENETAFFAGLEQEARLRGFECASLYMDDDKFVTVYGDPIVIKGSREFVEALVQDKTQIASVLGDNGERTILFSYPVSYPMPGDEKSVALVVGFPASSLAESLFQSENSSMVESAIIRKGGTYVIRDSGEFGHEFAGTYFEKWKDEKNTEKLAELKQAIDKNEDFTGVLSENGQESYIFATPLPYSEWYLITELPFGPINNIVNDMTRTDLTLYIGGTLIILAGLFYLFYRYYIYSREQIKVSEKLKVEAQKANQAKSEFLSNMSHDIRTPMNAIIGMTAIATTNIDDKNRVLHCLKRITLSSKHLLGLINDILDMSKIESGKMTLSNDIVSLKTIVNDLVALVQPQMKAKHQNFDVSVSNIITENVYCDALRLNQVLLNLMSNAIKFTPEQGSIRIGLYEKASSVSDQNVEVHFIVSDTGIGFSEDFKKVIFESFARDDNLRVTRTEGSGLGMAITKHIVDAMHGEILIDSKVNEGSTFHIVVDLEKAPNPDEKLCLPNWTMLLVDDDEQLCQTAQSALAEIGIRADYITDGHQTLSCLRQKRYDTILLDWKLDDLDGIEIARQIRKTLDDHIPIILISAYDWSDFEQEALDAGVDGFIQKPLFASSLYAGLVPFANRQTGTEPAAKPEMFSFAGRRLLVAEDNELNWEIAHDLLEEEGFLLEWAQNGQEALDMFARSPAGYYDAVLMDIRMPKMNGFESTKAIRALRREDRDVPIFAMTADAFVDDAKKAREAGMDAHIPKPIDVDVVLNELRKHLK